MALPEVDAWLVFNLWGEATGLHVRWLEDGEIVRHSETWDEPLPRFEAQRLLEFVLSTA